MGAEMVFVLMLLDFVVFGELQDLVKMRPS